MSDPQRGDDDLRRFYKLSIDMLGIAGFDGRFRELSAAWERVLGHSREELMAAQYIDFVHPDDREATLQQAASLTTGVETIAFDNRYRCRDGSYRWLEWNSTPYPAEGLVYFVARDVTERKRAEETRQGLEEKLRRLMGNLPPQVALDFARKAEILRYLEEYLPIAIWVMDREGVFLRHEGKALASIGFEQGHYVGYNVFKEFDRFPEFLQCVRTALAGQPAHMFAESMGLPWENWHFPLHDEHGVVKEVVGISLDISEAKRAEKELRAKIALIERQQEVIRALGTPIIEVWEKVLAVPMIGAIHSGQAAEMMERLLERVSRTGSRFALLDLTGVDAMDTATAGHLLKLVEALRLLGAEGIITGIQPSVAQTMVTLGVDLGRVVTLANLYGGLQLCMTRMRGLGPGAHTPGAAGR